MREVLRVVAHDEGRDVDARGLEVFGQFELGERLARGHAVVSDERICEDEDLALVGRIRQGLGISDHTCTANSKWPHMITVIIVGFWVSSICKKRRTGLENAFSRHALALGTKADTPEGSPVRELEDGINGRLGLGGLEGRRGHGRSRDAVGDVTHRAYDGRSCRLGDGGSGCHDGIYKRERDDIRVGRLSPVPLRSQQRACAGDEDQEREKKNSWPSPSFLPHRNCLPLFALTSSPLATHATHGFLTV